MKLLICVTFHFNSGRIKYLEKVLSSFPELAEQVTTYVITNTFDLKEINKIKSTLPDKKNNYIFEIKSRKVKSSPYDLILAHKEFLLKNFINSSKFTHFLHTEDDLLIKKNNIQYWLENRVLLKKYGLFPSFFRIEKMNKDDFYRSTDVGFQVLWFLAPKIKLDDLYFVNMPNPSQSNYLLDKDLAKEMLDFPVNLKRHYYLNSNVGIREKTNTGAMFSNVPNNFISRNVVPVLIKSYKIDSNCFIIHLPGNYANNNNLNLGKINIDKIFYFLPLLNSTFLRNIKYFVFVFFVNKLLKFYNIYINTKFFTN